MSRNMLTFTLFYTRDKNLSKTPKTLPFPPILTNVAG